MALFVRGESLADAGGGVVIDAKDPARARAAVPRLLGALRLRAGVVSRPVALDRAAGAFEIVVDDLPQPVYVATTPSRVVVAYGRGAALAALGDGPRLRDSDAWRRAEGVLDGLEPVVVVDARSAMRVAEQAAAGDPQVARAKPYLETVSVIAGGSRRDGDLERSRLAASVDWRWLTPPSLAGRPARHARIRLFEQSHVAEHAAPALVAPTSPGAARSAICPKPPWGCRIWRFCAVS